VNIVGKTGSMPNYETVEEYIGQQTPEAASKLREIREIIKEVVPEAEELLNYKIPSFTLVSGGKRDHQMMMAAYAKFIGFYPFPSTMEHFSEELKGFKQGKGSVQFPLNQPLPRDLIARMVAFRRDEILKG
jgi:uncharacterized protein YdhG (YjbR/CyaY superfamily)